MTRLFLKNRSPFSVADHLQISISFFLKPPLFGILDGLVENLRGIL